MPVEGTYSYRQVEEILGEMAEPTDAHDVRNFKKSTNFGNLSIFERIADIPTEG